MPKGGGALRGIGETFRPDLHTGVGNFSVPLTVPSGRAGIQPRLNLLYSSGHGNGPFGLGWSLGIPGVTRKTSKGVPAYTDGDVFVLSGAEDLVPVPGAPVGQQRYRPRTEGMFALIDRVKSGSDDYWRVQSKDGLVSLYGTPAQAGSDPAAVARPDDSRHVFAWRLTRTEDPFGNAVVYEYARDRDTSTDAGWDQRYLERIQYVDYVDDHGDAQFLVHILFDYGTANDIRPDAFSDFRAGFEIRTRRLCRRLHVETHADNVTRRVRTYEFEYVQDRANGTSLLHTVAVVGYDDAGAAVREMPAVEFGYSQFEPRGRRFVSVGGSELPARSLMDSSLDIVDLFGNGLPDLVDMNGVVRYWRNLGDARFDVPRTMRDAPAGVSIADRGVQLIDANGDGRSDLLVTTPPLAGYYPLEFPAQWSHRSFQRYRFAPTFDLEDPEVRLVDLDGDGVTDALRSGTRLECFFNDPVRGWLPSETRSIPRTDSERVPPVSFSDPRVKLADMNGDGLHDIVLVYDGNVEYWPNMGRGAWGRRVRMHRNPRLPHGYDPKRLLMGDVDGDGLADLVYVDHRQVYLWINQSGTGWSEPITIEGTPLLTDFDSVRLVDLLGNGIVGVLWSADATRAADRNFHFLDFSGGVKPYLLTSMDNRLGAVTRVEYQPSTRFFIADQQRHATHWQTPLPFPVHVVARVEVIDAIARSKLTTSYRYHHGYWDGVEREFRGFGMVEQLDTEEFTTYHQAGLHGDARAFEDVQPAHFSRPALTKTWFHLGAETQGADGGELDLSAEYWPGDPPMLRHAESVNAFMRTLPAAERRDALRTLRGTVLRTELYAVDGSSRESRPFTVVEHAYGIAPIAPGIYHPHKVAQRTTEWERGDDPMTTFEFTADYDAFGQPRRHTSVACPRGWRSPADVSAAYLATRQVTRFAAPGIGSSSYIRDRIAWATTYEVRLTTPRNVFALRDAAEDDPDLTVIGQTIHYYDRDNAAVDNGAFVGLPVGQVGSFGVIVRTEVLTLTPAILDDAYRSGDTALPTPERPPCFDTTLTTWPAEYPLAYRTATPESAGYIVRQAMPGAPYASGFFVIATQRRYDFHERSTGVRGLCTAERDPLGHETRFEYDACELFPAKVVDAVGTETRAVYNYRVLQPARRIDVNANEVELRYSALGLLSEVWTRGDPTLLEGDRARPSVRYEYDFLAFARDAQPISVSTTHYVHHDTNADVAPGDADDTIRQIEFSDGFGRPVQTRMQGDDVLFGADAFGGRDAVLPARQVDGASGTITGRRADTAAPNVIVSGWQVYDNKGRVVERFEPFFDRGWRYSFPDQEQFGQKITFYYDPRGQTIRTVNPDGSEQRVIYGSPVFKGSVQVSPQPFDPTPWEMWTYDATDNAGRTHPLDSLSYRHHWDTPTSTTVDALGRPIETVRRNRAAPASSTAPLSAVEEVRTRTTYDVRGNPLTVTDPLGRVMFRYVYDLTGRPWRTESPDAGVSRVVFDAAGHPIEERHATGAVQFRSFDDLGRLTREWCRDDGAAATTLRQRLTYGDDASTGVAADDRRRAKLNGRLYQHGDEAGLVTCSRYDFKGNLLEKSRRPIRASLLTAPFDGPPVDWQVRTFRVDWPDDQSTIVEADEYVTSTTYDALNRVTSLQYPANAAGDRSVRRTRYTRGGAIESVSLDGDAYIEHIAYTAKRQRSLVLYGNGVLTRYAYDSVTFRLARTRTEAVTRAPGADPSYVTTGRVIQDIAYDYDIGGNIIATHDRTPQSGLPAAPDQLDRTFTYDPLNRLTMATGRECDTPPPAPPWVDTVRCQDATSVRAYTQSYDYDANGNLTSVRHVATNGGSVTRRFILAADNNRLDRVVVGADAYPYSYDAAGNITSEATSRRLEWDHGGRLKTFRVQTPNAEPSLYAQYLYDASGQRVMKVVRTQGGAIASTVYIEGCFEHCRWIDGGNDKACVWYHVMDDQQRVAMHRQGDVHPDDRGPEYQFHLGDHLRSSGIVVGGASAAASGFVNREEFYPYGESSFGSFGRKRYRFTGKERDEESGLSYHGSRYYSAPLGRWISCDREVAEDPSPYVYCHDSPMLLHDPNGRWAEAGHYWTVYALSLFAGFSNEVSYRSAFFTQMPDEVVELDAAATGKSRPLDVFRKPANKSHYMEVQTGLHALSGRPVAEERAFRAEVLTKPKRAPDPGTPAFGLALHAYGDSYPHARDDDSGLMHGTPYGHARLSVGFGTDEDEIDKNADLYGEYVRSLYQLLRGRAKQEGLREVTLAEIHIDHMIEEVTAAKTEAEQIKIIQGYIDTALSDQNGISERNDRRKTYAPENEEGRSYAEFAKKHGEASELPVEDALQLANDWMDPFLWERL